MTQDEINAVKKAAEKMKKQESAQDEIIVMAQECGLIGMRPHLDGIYSESLIAFAKLIAAKERDDIIEIVDIYGGSIEIVAAIRARGEA